MPEAETMMPDGLTKTTCPLDWIAPAIVDGMLAVVTRLRIAELASGRLKLATLPAPTLNDCQSTIARAVVALTSVMPPDCTIAAAPATT